MNKIITIIGGHGQMGSLFSQLFSEHGATVHKIGENDWQLAPAMLAESDLVIICVPINLTNLIIEKIAPHISISCILADFSSIKTEPLMKMLECHLGPVIGLHPMFGPSITNAKSQVIIACKGRYPEAYQWVLTFLIRIGFTIRSMSAVKHDQTMSFVQGIEHFLTFSLGTFLHHKNEHPEELIKVASPIYLTKLLLLGRIFDQDPALYADIIMAENSRIELILEFSEWLQGWAKDIKNNNRDKFIEEFNKTAQWMGNFTAYSQKISDDFLNSDLTNK